MYIARLLNQRGLFQCLGGWRKAAPAPQLDRFLHRATSTVVALSRLRALEEMIAAQFRSCRHHLSLSGARIALWSPEVVQLLGDVSPVLSTIRIMQNLVVPLAAIGLKLQGPVPSSLADAVRALDRLRLPRDLSSRIRAYWQTTGNELKDYRDLDQHFTTIIEHCYFETNPVERLVILLPDDPKQKKAGLFTFEKCREAVPFAHSAFSALHDLMESIAAELGYQATSIEQSLNTAALPTLVEGERRTLALLIEDSEAQAVIEVGQTPERRIYVRQLPEDREQPG